PLLPLLPYTTLFRSKLADPGRDPRVLTVGDVLQRGDLRRVDLAGPAAASRRPGPAGLHRRSRLDHELAHRIPRPALVALALPFVVVGATFGADVGDLGLGGGLRGLAGE